jgi:hypothetical protein
MINITPNLFYISLLAFAAAGCDNAINQKAVHLANDISAFRDNQSKRLEEINAGFDQSYKDSIAMLEEAKKQELRLDRDRDAQRIADQIVSDRNNSLRSTFRDNLAQIVITERTRIAEADQSIEEARENYSKAYQKTSLALDKLDSIISDLNLLGQSQKDWKDYYKLIAGVDKVYQGLQSQAAAPAPAPEANTPQSKNSPTGAASLTRSVRRLQLERKAAGTLAP